MPRQSQPTRKNKPGKPKEQKAVKKANKGDDSRLLDQQDHPSERSKKDTTGDSENQDSVPQPPSKEEKQGLWGSKSQKKTSKTKAVAGILSTQDSNLQSHDKSQMTRRRSSRVVATQKGKPSYCDPSSSTTEDDDSDDESDVSLVSVPKSNIKDVASNREKKSTTARASKNPTKAPLHPQRSSPSKSPKKKARLVSSTVGTPLYSGIDIKKPSPASSSIKEITKNMWKENEGDWRVESAMDY